MKIIGMLLCRNEDWILGFSLRAALMWCDEVVVLLHRCTDASAAIVEEVGRENIGRVSRRHVSEEDWPEMQHRQMMLERARELGGTHLAIVDADEILSSNLLGNFSLVLDEKHIEPSIIRCALASVERGMILQLPGYNTRNAIDLYHSNGIWGKRWFSLAFQDEPVLGWSGHTFHKREPQGRPLRPFQPIPQGAGGILHLWGASHRRLVAKHALYKLREAIMAQRPLDIVNREYSWAIHGRGSGDQPSTWEYASAPASWLAGYSHLMHHLHLDAVPWQEAECRRLVDVHGKKITEGLDLFGVV